MTFLSGFTVNTMIAKKKKKKRQLVSKLALGSLSVHSGPTEVSFSGEITIASTSHEYKRMY